MGERHNPEYRAWCENGDLHGYAEIQQVGETWEVTLYTNEYTMAREAGYGAADGDFPLTETFTDEASAHRYGRAYADALVKKAREQDKADWGGEANEDAHHVQNTDGAYMKGWN